MSSFDDDVGPRRPSKRDRRADDILRRLRAVARTDGVIVAEPGRLALLTRVPATPPAPLVAARLLLPGLASVRDADRAGSRGGRVHAAERARDALGAGEVIELDAGRIGRWSYHLSKLEGRGDDLDALRRDGARALRRYRGRDLAAELRATRARLRRYRAVSEAMDAAGAFLAPAVGADGTDDIAGIVGVVGVVGVAGVAGAGLDDERRVDPWTDPSAARLAEQLIRALPVRLHALAVWRLDPVRRLCQDVRDADALLTRAATDSDADPDVSALAAAILGRRSRRLDHAARARLGAALTGPARAAFALAADRDDVDPCLVARFAVRDSDVRYPDTRAAPRRARARVAATADRVAIGYGVAAAREALAHLSAPWRAPNRRSRARWRWLRRFVTLCRVIDAGESPRRGGEWVRDLARRLAHLPSRRVDRARGVTSAFLAWMAAGDSGADRARPDARDAGLARPITRRELARAARDAASGSRADMAEALAALWSQTWADADAPRPTRRAQTARLAISLLQPDAALRLDTDACQGQALDRLVAAVAGIDADRARRLWPHLVARAIADELDHSAIELVHAAVDTDLIERALRAGVVQGAVALASEPAALARYLACADACRARAAHAPWLSQEWFWRLFRGGAGWAQTVVLALIAHGGKARRDDVVGAVASLHALSEALASRDTSLSAALDAWAAVRVIDPPADVDALAAYLDVPRADLESYLHHRRLAGDGEVIPKSLRGPLRRATKEAAQIAYLEAQIAAAETTGAAGDEATGDGAAGDVGDSQRDPAIATLRARLAHLRDPERGAARAEAERHRARRTLARGAEAYRRRSLEAVLDGACREAAARVLGGPLPAVLPPGFRDAFHLLAAEETDLALFRRFLNDVLAGRPHAVHPENQAWLARAQAAGIDTEAWCAGIAVDMPLPDGGAIALACEADPLHVLRMGSYFSTCLSLETGFNRASTLMNAIDVNKHVIYGRLRGRPKPSAPESGHADLEPGVVVARKLIGATAAGELAGYQTYVAPAYDGVRAHLDAALRAFARRVGLRPSDTATPEVLHEGFWYDDGNEPWLVDPDELDASDGGEGSDERVPADTDARIEYGFRRALLGHGEGDALIDQNGQSGDRTERDARDERTERDAQDAQGGRVDRRDRLAVLVRRVANTRADFLEPLCFWLLMHLDERGDDARRLSSGIRLGAWTVRESAQVCTALGHLGWLPALPALVPEYPECAEPACALAWSAPWTAAGADACLRALPAALAGFEHDDPAIPGAGLAFGEPARLVHTLDAVDAHNRDVLDRCGGLPENAWRDRMTAVLEGAWLRARDPAPLARALARARTLAWAAGFLANYAVPAVAPALRRQLRAADEREDAEPLALALGRCGDPGDGPRLLALLARWPASLPLAVAAARSGRGDDARARWIPPSPQTALDHACRDAAWVELARELASPKLGRRIRRAIARRRRGDPAATEGSTEVPIEAWLAHLGALGLSGLNPVDVARADGIQMRRPRNREALGAAGARWSVAHRADALAADIAAGGASMTAAIATVRDADIAVEQRPAPITRALLRRAARGSGSIDERAVALDALLGRHDDAHGYARHRLALRAAVAALDAAPDLPASIHARMANALVPPTGFSGVAEAVALWTWVSPRPVSERAALIATHVRHRDWSAAAIPYGMRRIEADATLRDALVSRYADAYADDPEGVLRTLNTAMSWMHPAIAEPWVADIAARIAADDVRERDLLTVLRDHDGQFSYRLQRLMTQCVIPRLPAAGQASLAAGIVEVRRGSWLRSIWPAHTSD